MRPVLVLPVRDPATLAKRVRPVVPRLTPERVIGSDIEGAALALLCLAKTGHDLILEEVNCLMPKHWPGYISSHYAPPIFVEAAVQRPFQTSSA